MPISLIIPDEIAEAAVLIAQQSGAPVEQVLVEALQAHFPPVDAELQVEFDAWERAADEDAARLDGEAGLA